jgi:hypothetical protein
MRHEYPQRDRLKSAHFISKLLQARSAFRGFYRTCERRKRERGAHLTR